MRIRNLSSLSVPFPLWHAIAGEMRVGTSLPRANDVIGLYGSCTSLCVTVRPRMTRTGGEGTVGHYTCGKIVLLPCTKCTVGFMTWLFLHEVTHAWTDQYFGLRLYLSREAESLADRFADAAFASLGGVRRDEENCSSYRLAINKAERSFSRFQRVAASLVDIDPDNVLRWRPPKG